MKLNRIDKIIGIVTIILVIIATIQIISNKTINKKTTSMLNNFNNDPYSATWVNEEILPDNIKKYSEKYETYQELYNSDELTLVYGYEVFNHDERLNSVFHRKLSKKIKNKNLNYRIVALNGYQHLPDQLLGNYQEDVTCRADLSKDLNALINTSENCLETACIVDMKNNRYIHMGRNIDTIVETLEKYNPSK